MSTRMLIDARHQEETRVAVVRSNKIEEFDFESAEHKQIKGNIYLAKVTRVEPSLQAAFVDYGGNRHGFLAFSEIHPDYYQIPKEDRLRLLAEEAEHAAEEAALREQEDDDSGHHGGHGGDGDDDFDGHVEEVDKDDSIDTIDISEGQLADGSDQDGESDGDSDADTDTDGDDHGSDGDGDGDGDTDAGDGRGGRRRRGRSDRGKGGREGGVAKASDQARAKRLALRRRYKIQDVIQRRQVVLVQVVKEERGNKGAALTTYLSLAGRYCVLMPNTSHGGGISRKINSASDRKRLKSIVDELKLPATMGCIVRTAGMARTKPEIKRDFDYLARLWDEIREKTLKATAPALIHSDSDLIKRAIRDIYNREIEEVLVEGGDGYRAAKDFMKLLMPSHSRRVKSYADPVSLFQRYGVEDQLSAMYQPEVKLPSGGYLVINPTEALVSIDINSGRSTKEHGIEATAVKTNLEAAREIARQLRLRDMAGLVVIDFIDMDRHGNVRKVEKAMREALRNDRARIQVGRISSFGLMEMSRQRLRTGVLEASTRTCQHCEGTGLVRTATSSALSALRLIEEEAARGRARRITLRASQEATIYVLNHKRREIAEIEARYGVEVDVQPDGENEGAKMTVSGSGGPPENAPVFEPIIDLDNDDDIAFDDSEAEDDGEERSDRTERGERGEDGGRRPRKRRRGRRSRGRREDGERAGYDSADRSAQNDGENDADAPAEPVASDADESAEPGADAKPKRRRGGRRKKAVSGDATEGQAESPAQADPADGDADAENAAPAVAEAGAAKKPVRRRGRKTAETAEAADAGDGAAAATPDQGGEDEAEAEAEPKPKAPRSRRKKAADNEATASDLAANGSSDTVATAAEPPAAKPVRKAAAKVAKDDGDGDGENISDGDNDSDVSSSHDTAAMAAGTDTAAATPADTPAEPPRKGWWQRTFG